MTTLLSVVHFPVPFLLFFRLSERRENTHNPADDGNSEPEGEEKAGKISGTLQ